MIFNNVPSYIKVIYAPNPKKKRGSPTPPRGLITIPSQSSQGNYLELLTVDSDKETHNGLTLLTFWTHVSLET